MTIRITPSLLKTPIHPLNVLRPLGPFLTPLPHSKRSYRFFSPYLATHCPNSLIDPESKAPEPEPTLITPSSSSEQDAAPPAASSSTDDASTGSSSTFSFNNTNPPTSEAPQDSSSNPTTCISSAETSPSSSPLRGEASDSVFVRPPLADKAEEIVKEAVNEALTRKVSVVDTGKVSSSSSSSSVEDSSSNAEVAMPVTPAAGSVSVLSAAAALEAEEGVSRTLLAVTASVTKTEMETEMETETETSNENGNGNGEEGATAAVATAAATTTTTAEVAPTEAPPPPPTTTTTTTTTTDSSSSDSASLPPGIPPTTLPLHVTYAAAPFADAGLDPSINCPPGGTWKGFFENTPKKNGKVFERFVIYINAKRRCGEGDRFMRVEGSGSNKFGTFSLLGTFDPVYLEVLIDKIAK